VRAKLSSTATGMYSSTESSTSFLPIRAVTAALSRGPSRNDPQYPQSIPAIPSSRTLIPDAAETAAQAQGEALLHDARNLIGTLGLYCDLLSMPGVLKPQHRQYADDLRIVGTRSEALIERLIARLVAQPEPCSGEPNIVPCFTSSPTSPPLDTPPAIEAAAARKSVSLRRIVEHCTSLLSRVADGREIEVRFGEAATVPVAVPEEAVERILVNLVRNAATALTARTTVDSATAPAPIRIAVGMLANRVGDLKPWPFRRVRLTVEDSGCGMMREQLERLLSPGRAPTRGGHGIGFRVVQELVAASDGDLRVMSQPGNGTCVQIEWPMDAASLLGRPAEGWSC
jgi:signal transduction histidine kinase